MRILSLLLAISIPFTVANAQITNQDPDKAKLVTSDIDRFWKAYDLAAKTEDPAEKARIFDGEYIGKGSKGLKGFIFNRIQNGKSIVRTLKRYPRYYASIREDSYKARLLEPKINESFHNLKTLYPKAVFPDVYFVIGRLNSGGTTSNVGLLIGMEMHCRTKDSPLDELTPWHKSVLASLDNLPHIVAHESIHYQQRVPRKTLLEKSLQEGGADLLAELMSGKHINEKQQIYGDANEASLWREFSLAMDGEDLSKWMYNGNRSKDRPADLGYYMGYKISKAFYEKSSDKKAAIDRILNFKDAKKLLAESGYSEKFKSSKNP